MHNNYKNVFKLQYYPGQVQRVGTVFFSYQFPYVLFLIRMVCVKKCSTTWNWCLKKLFSGISLMPWTTWNTDNFFWI